MDRAAFLSSLLREGQTLRPLEPDLFSVVADEAQEHAYDRKAWFYDLVVGNSLYNRILWGNWASAYAAFCREALAGQEGVTLDAGCGTLTFTHRVYAQHAGPLILLDRSLGMLRRARARLERSGGVPERVVFLQGDAFALPFADGALDAVVSFGVLHLFTERRALVAELARALKPDGAAHLTCLVTDRWLGRLYYGLLHRAGEIGPPTRGAALRDLLADLLDPLALRVGGNMAYLSRLSGR